MSRKSERQARIEKITRRGIDLASIRYKQRKEYGLNRRDYLIEVASSRLVYVVTHFINPQEISDQND